MLNPVGVQASKWAGRWLPDLFLLAIGLTTLHVLVGVSRTDGSQF